MAPQTSKDLVLDAIRSEQSDFYRSIWGDAADFSALPITRRRDLARVPLSKRRYANESGITKIVPSADGTFLMHADFASIRAQEWGVVSRRPMVHLSDPYETLEKAAWCRERGCLPIAGERDPGVSRYLAEKYDIDSLIADPDTLPALSPYLAGRVDPLEAITVIAPSFNTAALLPFARFARRLRLVLALPETGAIAEAPLDTQPTFTPFPHALVEVSEGRVVLTQLLALSTPIIRYDTGIRAASDGAGAIVLEG